MHKHSCAVHCLMLQISCLGRHLLLITHHTSKLGSVPVLLSASLNWGHADHHRLEVTHWLRVNHIQYIQYNPSRKTSNLLRQCLLGRAVELNQHLIQVFRYVSIWSWLSDALLDYFNKLMRHDVQKTIHIELIQHLASSYFTTAVPWWEHCKLNKKSIYLIKINGWPFCEKYAYLLFCEWFRGVHQYMSIH